MIGYEFEFLVREGDIPLTKATFLRFHKELKKRGWKQKFDSDTNDLAGSYKDDTSIITDNGICNLELNMPPTETVIESHKKIILLLKELQGIYKTLGASIVGVGVFPGPADFDHAHCKEYCTASRICAKGAMRYCVTQRRSEHHLTHLFSGQHTWLDLLPHDVPKQLAIFNRLNPFLVALFANGPIFNEQPLSMLEGRDELWMRELRTSTIPYDLTVYGMYQEEYKDIFEYFDFILDMPFSFSNRNGKSFKLADASLTFRDFLYSKEVEALYGHGGTLIVTPTLEDFLQLSHATFPHTRLKYFLQDGISLDDILTALKSRDEDMFLGCFRKLCIEVRTASAQPEQETSTAPALLLGLQSNLEETERYVSQFSYKFLKKLYSVAERNGLKAKIEGRYIADGCATLMHIAEKGLEQRGFGEERYLIPLRERVAKRENPAQELLKIWHRNGLAGIWNARDF